MKQPEKKVVSGNPSLKVRLVDATLSLLVEPGGTILPTMREIAISAGVAPGAAYRHFNSQADLVMAVIEHLYDELESELTEATKEAPDAKTAVYQLAQTYVAWGLKNPGGYQLMLETTDDEALLASDKRPGLHLLGQLAGVISEYQKSSQEQIELAVRIWVSLHGVVTLRTHKKGMTWPNSVEEEVNSLLEIFLNHSR